MPPANGPEVGAIWLTVAGGRNLKKVNVVASRSEYWRALSETRKGSITWWSVGGATHESDRAVLLGVASTTTTPKRHV